MSVTLDGQVLFDQQQLSIEPDSLQRDSIERKVPGLDGILSIDLGSRTRIIKQKGIIRAKSKAKLSEKINAVSAYIDGKTHTLITHTGEELDNLRMDVFKLSNERTGGSNVEADYEIIYTQLI
jgi:hypothetical protein